MYIDLVLIQRSKNKHQVSHIGGTMLTTTHKTNYRHLPLSAQLERGLELFKQGQYDLAEMMKNWGQNSSPYIRYNPETDTLEYSYAQRGFYDPMQEAAECLEEQNIMFFPIIGVDCWIACPGEKLDSVPENLWTRKELETIYDQYDGDYEAYLADNPKLPSYLDRCIAATIYYLDPGNAIAYTMAGIAWLKENEKVDYTKLPLSAQLEI